LESAIVIDEAGGRLKEVEEYAVGLAAEKHEVEDLYERWEPHCAGFDVLETVRYKVENACNARSGYSLCYKLTCEDGDIRIVIDCLGLVEQGRPRQPHGNSRCRGHEQAECDLAWERLSSNGRPYIIQRTIALR
jgi:hypothetical protein